MCVCVYMCVCVCMCVYIYIYIYICVCVCVCVCACVTKKVLHSHDRVRPHWALTPAPPGNSNEAATVLASALAEFRVCVWSALTTQCFQRPLRGYSFVWLSVFVWFMFDDSTPQRNIQLMRQLRDSNDPQSQIMGRNLMETLKAKARELNIHPNEVR